MSYPKDYLHEIVDFKRYSPNHYHQVAGLWEQHGWKNPVPESCLPDGWLALVEGVLFAACFVYKAGNANMAVVDYAVLNKYASREVTHPCLEFVINKCVDDAREHVGDQGIIMTLSSHPGIQQFNAKCGFDTAETNVTTMVIPVGFKTNLDFIKDR